MLSLRRDIRDNYEKKGTDTVEKITEEDIQRLEKAKTKMFVWPAIAMITAYGVGWLIGRSSLSGMMTNHLIEEESTL